MTLVDLFTFKAFRVGIVEVICPNVFVARRKKTMAMKLIPPKVGYNFRIWDVTVVCINVGTAHPYVSFAAIKLCDRES